MWPRLSLRTWNWIAVALFACLFIFTLAALASRRRMDISVAVANTVVRRPPGDSSGQLGPSDLVPETQDAGRLALAPLLLGFIGITLVAHAAYALGARKQGFYLRAIEAGHQPWRWLEYGLSATLMAVLIAAMSGVRERSSLLLVGTLTAVTMAMGYMVEQGLRATQPGVSQALRIGVPTFAGWLAFGAVWAIIGTAFFQAIKQARDGDGPQPPAWLKAIFWSQLLLFGSFGAIQAYQILKRPKSYYSTEGAYIAASFTAKALLAGLLMGGLVFAGSNA
jgi:hypothetical protein